MSDLILSIENHANLLIPSDLIAELEKYRQLSIIAPEQGGSIVGIYRPPHIEVTNFTCPQPEDKQERFEFIRRSIRHIDTVYDLWKKSNEFETYMGEWHTHPEDDPTPSGYDMREWRSKLPKGRRKILIIVGRKTNWYGYWNGDRIINLPLNE